MAEETPGRKFFDEHMGYLMSGNLEGMIKDQYTPDAIMITAWDLLDVPPPHILHAGPDMVEFFRKWLAYHANMSVESLYDFAETEDSIFFQVIVNSQAGRWVMGEAWHLAGDKIDRQYGYIHQLG